MIGKIKTKCSFYLTICAIIIAIAFNTNISILAESHYKDIYNTPNIEYKYNSYDYKFDIDTYHYMIKNQIINEIDNYIDSIAPNSILNGITLFEVCDKYNIDICFAMAQAQLESHFGAAGIAKTTNSVWNIGALDGISAEDMIKKGLNYKHPDHSIEPYIEYLYNNYLSDGRTEYDLMKKYTNIHGQRYASDINYEKKLTNVYNRIVKYTNISDNYQEYKKYKMTLKVKL